MVPADSKNIREEYNVLLHELKEYNPELLDKPRILAITKSDLLDKELKVMVKKELPKIQSLFISAITTEGIQQLKDMIWKELNKQLL